MQKLIDSIIASALIVIILLVLPFGVLSFWLKNNYQKSLAHLAHTRHVDLKLLKFDRGWFASNATPSSLIIPTQENHRLFGKMNQQKKLHVAWETFLSRR